MVADRHRTLVPAALPPMHLASRDARRPRSPAFLPQLARASCALAALAFPAAALAVSDGLQRIAAVDAPRSVAAASPCGDVSCRPIRGAPRGIANARPNPAP